MTDLNKRLSIDRVEWVEGSMSNGTKVIMSDGSELHGVISAVQEGGTGEPQYITVKVLRRAGCGGSLDSRPGSNGISSSLSVNCDDSTTIVEAVQNNAISGQL